MRRFVVTFMTLFLAAACTESVVPPTSSSVSSSPSTILSSTPSPSTTLVETPYTTVARVPFTELLVLDVYQPPGIGPRPVAVLVHGGGWVGGERADIADLAALLATEGFVVYNISYRTIALGGSYPFTFDDIACGVRFARATAGEYAGDGNSVALIGYSAGAHLGAVVALAGDEFAGDCLVEGGSALPDAFVGVAGPYDSDDFSPLLIPFFGGSRNEAGEAWAAGNPYSYLDRRTDLPIHLLQGTADGTVPQRFTIDFATALEAAGHVVELTLVNGAGHRDMVDPAEQGPLVVEAVLGLLR